MGVLLGGGRRPMMRHGARPRAGLQVALVALVALGAALAAAEAGARMFLAYREGHASWQLDLDPYEVEDARQPGQWRLRPGYTATLSQLLEEKAAAGRIQAVALLQRRGAELGIGPEERLFEVNPDGFKGPALDPGHRRVRVLTLGDSCTFGSWLDRSCYPRVLEADLQRRGRAVEVVNGGVEGYGPRNVLQRLPEYLGLSPEVVTLYLGWNSIYDEEAGLPGIRHRSALLRLFDHVLRRLRARAGGGRAEALQALQATKMPDRGAPEIREFAGYQPSCRGDIERIVDAFRAAGSRVVVLTLPGLYLPEEEPGPRALAIGHLPVFTRNPFVLAVMTRRFNEVLREIAAARGLQVVDLEAWSRTALVPRDGFFIDSVHLTEEGQKAIGEYLAAQLLAVLPAAPRR